MTVTGAEGYYNATLDYGDGCTTVTDGKGIHCYYYDPDGNILREAAPDGSTTTYEWDEFHHLLARHSPAGRVEKFEYNAAHGQLSRYTAADGAEWQYRYDERGLLSNITDPAGQTWTQQCDERGLPVSLVSPQGEETRLAYTAQGLLSGIFRQDERRLGIEYDHHNRPETLTDVMGREHHTEYSGHDLPVKMRGPGGQSVRLQWQQHHKLSGIERAETGAEGFRYDRHGNLLAYTDGNGVVWTMEYGPFDLPVARTDGEGHRWQYRYDKDTLQLTEVINPQGESYRYILDNCGRVTEERDWGGVVWRYRYDADGLCTARVNGLEETILYSRDAAGRLAEVITPEGKTQYAYDKSGRLTGIFSPDGTSQRTGYDERGRVNVTTQGRRAIEYHYPDEHTVIRCILPPEDERDRHPDESLLKTTYRYNAAGELTEVILPGDETLTFSRDEAGREVFRHSNRGFACEQGWNAASQLVSQRAGFFPEEATWDGLVPSLVQEYRYDSAGNVSGVTSREDYGRETRREYRLDRNGQVTAVTASGTGLGYGEGDETYGYDSCGYTVQFADNRQYVVGATLPVLLKEGQYDAAQKLLATLPANEMLEERYAVSVATRNKAESLRLARLLYQQEPANLTRLDQLTWQLMQNEQSREAADLLLQRYPFQGDARVSQTLMARLASLLESHPYLATPAKVAILSKPLPLAAQRQWQSQLPGIADNCPAIVRLLGDMSPSYDAAAWNRLAKCYRDTLPGVALYAWLQAEQRQPNAWQHRAVAYQAYQVEDYATALAAWQKISLHDMSNEDLLAAANTAQAAGNGAARDRWLQQAEQRGLGNNALYWWLHAQRYIPGQPELALSDLTRSINIAPSANAYVARATIYRQRHNVPAAVSDLRAALELEPNNSNIQAALGYALWDSGDIAQSREMLEQAHKGLPDDPALIRQLAYVNQRLDDMPATQHYARLVIDDIDNQALINPLTPEQNQQRFNFRRLHEEVGRRWTFSFDSSIGLRSGAMSTANNNVGGAAPGKSYRSYGQLEAEYRIGRNMLLEGDLLSVYSRVFADTGENGVMMPVKNPMSGTGLRWKPLRDQIFFLAVEQQLPLNGQNGASDTMLRASASFFNGGKYSDEWHPNGSGWFAQNLYLDAAQYIRQDIQAWTADYRVSWHQKVANGQTIEPYAHVQDNGYRDKGTQGAQLGGVGVRWNIWTGETHYDAWPHKVSLGVEYQHTFKAINQRNGERNNAFLTIGVHW